MSLDLLVYNLSDKGRKGFVKTPWQPISERTGIPAEMVAVYDASGAQLDTQVQRIDPHDRSRDMLIFSLNEDATPRYGDYSKYSSKVTVDRRSRNMYSGNMRCDVEESQGIVRRVTLSNGKLHVQMELTPSITSPKGDKSEWGGWYAGSASSVVLGDKEMLDRFRAEIWIGHDAEKRCMQIDQLQLPPPAWGWEECQVKLFDKPYELLDQMSGPVFTGVTIASSPFDYKYYDPCARRDRTVICRLYRAISIYKNTSHIMEELFVKGRGEDVGSEAEGVSLRFKPSYFSYMDLGLDIKLERFTRIWDWFAIGYYSSPHQGYGFATNAHVGPVMNPHPEFSESPSSHKTFLWSLEETSWASCLHLFDHCSIKELESRVGNAWFDHIYRPLYARIA